MVDKVVVQKWKTFDGREHDSEASAVAWELHLRLMDKSSRVVEVLERTVREQHFSSLTKEHGSALFPYGYSYDDDLRYEQDRFLADLGSLIVDNWDALKLALDGP